MGEVGVKTCPFSDCQGEMKLEAKEDCVKELANLSGREKENYEKAMVSADGTKLTAVESWRCEKCGFAPSFYISKKEKV